MSEQFEYRGPNLEEVESPREYFQDLKGIRPIRLAVRKDGIFLDEPEDLDFDND